MTCPLSLGDILAVAQICWTIGKALTASGSEAPEKFRAAQSNFYALSEALKTLDAEVKRPGSIFAFGDTADATKNLIWNCSLKLEELKKIVEKYSRAMESDDTRRTFKQSFRNGFQRVMWTTEEKDLEGLIVELTYQTSTINTFISTTNSMALGRIESITGRTEENTERILEVLSNIPCGHVCDGGERSASVPPLSRSRPLRSRTGQSQNRLSASPPGRPHNPDGLPFVSEERCHRIDNMFFELQISEEREDGKYLICPSAQLNGLHFLAPQRPGQPRAELFRCNCKTILKSTGYHSKLLNNYFCGPKTFIAQSCFHKDGPSGSNSWWLLQPAMKVGSGKNLLLELKNPERRPQFAKIVASMLRTNVARNVLRGIINPFDLVRQAKNGPNPHERIQIAWAYDERVVGKKGETMHIEKLPWEKKLEFSDPADDPGDRYVHEEAVQYYFTQADLPNFSWYRMAMFESINKSNFMEDDGVEDAFFFLDHFHTSVELKVKLSDPLNPNNTLWAYGEFGGADVTYSDMSDNGKPTNELMFTVSRFTVESNKDLSSPRPVNCSLHFTFRPGNSESLMELYKMWKQYESLSTNTGSAAHELAEARSETPTKDTPRFLMRVENAVFTDFDVRANGGLVSLAPYGFDQTRTFRNCWLLGRRSYNRKSPLNFILRSVERDIHCHVNLSADDSRNLKSSTVDKTLSLRLSEAKSKQSDESKISTGWIYPRDPYGVVKPFGMNICGSLKLDFTSEPDQDSFLRNMQRLLDIEMGIVDEHNKPPPYRGNPESHRDHATVHEIFTENIWDTAAEDQAWEKTHAPDEHFRPTDAHNSDTPSDVPQRSNTLPSHSRPPLNARVRNTSWSPGVPYVQPHQLHPPRATARPSSMFIMAEGQTWEPPPQYTPPSIPEHQTHLEIPDPNWYHQPPPTATMPEAENFNNYTIKIDNSMNNLNIQDNQHLAWKSGGYPDYNQVPRAWAEPIGINKNLSPPHSPGSAFLENFAYNSPTINAPASPQTPVYYAPQQPQASPNRPGLKRCVATSEYEGDPVHREVSLKVGQVYDVIPQPDSPWMWIEGNSPHCPSGYAPKRNFREF